MKMVTHWYGIDLIAETEEELAALTVISNAFPDGGDLDKDDIYEEGTVKLVGNELSLGR